MRVAGLFRVMGIIVLALLVWTMPASALQVSKVKVWQNTGPSVKQSAVRPPAAKTSHKTGAAASGATKPKRKQTDRAGSPLHLNVKSALLMNMSTGAVYFEQNADQAIPPASITKLLTLYLIREAVAAGRMKMSTRIPVSERAAHTGGSHMYLRQGEQVPLQEMIKGISVVSANNACVAVAEYMTHGKPWEFVARMNAKAGKLGMTGSRFRNPNGLPATGQLTTARDVARLSAAYLRAFPESLAIHSMTHHTYHGVTKKNANSLLGKYRGADGLKTGFVCASGFNIAATAKRGRTRLLAVVLGAQSSRIREIETRKLLDYGFQQAAREASRSGSGRAAKTRRS